MIMIPRSKIMLLRLVHGLFAVYFLACLVYVYYAAWQTIFNAAVAVAVASLCVEGYVVFVLNHGDCPLIHLQRKVEDDKPFFGLFLPQKLAKQALPIFAALTICGLFVLLVRLGAV